MIDAVIDRIVDGNRLVLLVGEEEKEMIVPVCDKTARLKEGDWTLVRFDENGDIADIQPHPEKTNQRRAAIQNKMALLRARKGSRFKS